MYMCVWKTFIFFDKQKSTEAAITDSQLNTLFALCV